ncbi:MAG: hypothetical protein RMK49_22280, partial [Abditibacteriales bacterium]|nr:hypothetical protein [Abditibacteriales bacterium]
SAACVQAVQGAARQNYIHFRQGRRQGNEGHLCMWPLHAEQNQFYFQSVSGPVEHEHVIPDAVFPPVSNTEWLFYPTGAGAIGWTDIAE